MGKTVKLLEGASMSCLPYGAVGHIAVKQSEKTKVFHVVLDSNRASDGIMPLAWTVTIVELNEVVEGDSPQAATDACMERLQREYS